MEPLTLCLHYLAVFAVASLLVAELCLCNDHVQPHHIRLLARIDMLFLAAMGSALLSGVVRIFAVARSPAVFLANPAFWCKVIAFLAVGMLAAYPTRKFVNWNRAVIEGRERVLHGRELARVRRVLTAELAVLVLVPLLAVWAFRSGAAVR